MSIYVGNLSYAIITEDLQEVFGDYGTVTKVSLPIDRETGRPRGKAFIEMSSEASELEANNLPLYKGSLYKNRQISRDAQ